MSPKAWSFIVCFALHASGPGVMELFACLMWAPARAT